MAKSVVDIADAGDALNKIVRDLGIDGKRVVLKELQDMARYKFPQAVARFYPTVLRRRSGKLIQSMHGFFEMVGEALIRIGMRSRNVNYATIQHDGGQTAPHPIEPRHKKALFWEGAAHPVRRVPRHPGSTIPATKFFSEPMNREVDPLLKRIAKKIGFRK